MYTQTYRYIALLSLVMGAQTPSLMADTDRCQNAFDQLSTEFETQDAEFSKANRVLLAAASDFQSAGATFSQAAGRAVRIDSEWGEKFFNLSTLLSSHSRSTTTTFQGSRNRVNKLMLTLATCLKD